MCFSIPARSVPIASSAPSKSTQGSVYSTGDINAYQSDQQNQLKKYASLSAAQKSVAKTNEAVSIRGMVSVPAASDFTESKKSLNELVTQKGDIAKVPNIDICGFMGDLPSLDLDLPNAKIGDLPSLNDIMAGINGITLPALTIASEAITGIVGGISTAIGEIGAAIQGSIPTISCGKTNVPVEVPSVSNVLGGAITPPTVPYTGSSAPKPVPYGTTPKITIDSPDVTVQSLSDELDAGEI